MVSRYAAVTLGSPEFTTVDVGGFLVTEAHFAPDDFIPPHVHERACFCVMLQGSFDTTFTRHALSCLPGTVTTEPAGERHANRMCGGGAHVLVVQPELAQVEGLGGAADLFDGIHHVRDSGVAGTAWRIARELRAPDNLAPLAIEGLVLDMLVSAARSSDPGSREGRTAPGWLLRAEELVRSRFREPLRIAGIAAAVGVHPAHLARAFRARTGISIGLYVRRLRLDWAAGRLASSRDPLATVSLEAGFADQSHFTRSFRRYSGTTPLEYRRRCARSGCDGDAADR